VGVDLALSFAQRPLIKLLSFKITILALLGCLFKRIAYLLPKYFLEYVLVKFVAVSLGKIKFDTIKRRAV
jgi:hypothetical protein